DVLIDCGCGECYYTDELERYLKNEGKNTTFYGFDISRDAIIYGARRNKELSLLVAGVYHMPFCDEGADALFSIFSPFAREEFFRVLKKGGVLFSVIPTEKHLWSLKKAIYDTPYENELSPYEIEGFELIDKQEVKNRIALSGESLQNLFKMTPYYYRTKEKDRQKISSLCELEVETEFEILVYKKV
ncbi:MAG: methyltransferase domain-containing protein, partial [Clostridia bacterium]|nr:methyltransferase domain-containing protein [Clostridia bacterium]